MTRALPVLLLLIALLVGSTPAAATSSTVITVGTSIEAGNGLSTVAQSWPQRLAQRAPGKVFTDMSKGGGAWTNTDESGDNLRKHMQAAVAAHPDVIIVGGPVNDLVTLSDITPLREAVFEEVRAAQQAGIHVLVMAILPFNDGGALQAGWWPSLEQRRTAYNTWAQQMYGADFIDVGWAVHETTTYRADGRFFPDGLHPYRWGAALIAEVFPVERLG